MEKNQGTTGRNNALDLVLIAVLLVMIIDLIVLILPVSFHDTILSELQAALPILSLLLTIRIYFSTRDRNIRYLSIALSIYFVTSLISNVAWYLVPNFVNIDFVQTDLYYYIGGAGWLIGYAAIIYALYKTKNSRQWYLHPDLDRWITVAGACAFTLITALILIFIHWDSAKLPDIAILWAYLFMDMVILVLSAKLFKMKLRLELKFLVIAILLFFAINMMGDAIFESRWLFGIKYLGILKIRSITNFVYNSAALLITWLLFLYSSNTFKSRAMYEIKKRLKDTQLFVDDIIQQSPDGMCVFDSHGKLTLVNDAFLHIFNVKRNEIDRAFNIFHHLETGSDARKQFGMIRKVRDGETVIIPKLKVGAIGNRGELYVYVKMFPTYASDGSIANIVLILEDISERVKLENDLFKTYNTLKEEYEWKMNFTNAAAHELRTPLTPILGYAEILKSDITDEKHKHFLDVIERNALRQKEIISRMLEIASLDAGAVKPQFIEFAIKPILWEIEENYRLINGHIQIEVPADLNVYSDPDILAHVFDNLISNAVKYSRADQAIVISVQDTGASFQFSVQDNGIGIANEEWGKIFERFYIIDGKKDTRVTGRIGLGLPLVKQYLDLLGGKIWIESKPGKGSTFYFTIPKKKDRKPEA